MKYFAVIAALSALGGLSLLRKAEVARAPDFRAASKPMEAAGPITAKELGEWVAAGEKASGVAPKRRAVWARMKLAHQASTKGQFKQAQAEFLEAHEAAIRITSKAEPEPMDPAFGTPSEQALYQSIVCQAASGEKEEALQAFRKFIQDHLESPLCSAAYQRIIRLEGKPSPADEALLQQSVSAQDKRARFEMAMCGPKVLEALLKALGQPHRGYEEIAAQMSVTETGTSLEQLKEFLRSIGIASVGMELNRADLAKLKPPAILYETDHFVLIREVNERDLLVFDPRFNTDTRLAIPDIADPDFRAVVLAINVPDIPLAPQATPRKATPSSKAKKAG